MKKNPTSKSGVFDPRVLLAFIFCSIGAWLAMLSFAAPTSSTGPKEPYIQGPFFAISQPPASFDRDLRTLPPPVAPLTRRFFPRPRPRPGASAQAPASFTDTARQPSLAAAAPMPAPSASFKGLDFNTWGNGHPPDTVGDVGPNHYIQAVNTSFGIFSKTGTQLAAFTYNNFFDGTGTLCDTDNFGDPVVVYDPLADRWIISDFAFKVDTAGNPVAPFYQCFAVSKTGDPVAGGWWLYGIPVRAASDTQDLFNDYPKLGVWPDGIYMSANMFNTSGSFVDVRVWAFNRDDLESGAPVRQVFFNATDTNDFTLLPSNFRGTPPPAGRPNFFTSYNVNAVLAGTVVRVQKFHVDWATPSNSTFGNSTSVTVAQYREFVSVQSIIPELAGETLDSLGDRLMMQNQYRNIGGTESLWINHTVLSGQVAGIRWNQLNVTGGAVATTPVQDATFQPDTNFRWMGSMAVDRNGDMALGYSVSSAAMFPAIRYAGRLATDPLNQLSQTETSLIEGTGSQVNGGNRWGDYSAMSVDPSDDCTFWYTQEYYESPASADWQTRIGSFKFPQCVPPQPPPLSRVDSVKAHGSAGQLPVPLQKDATTHPRGVECRSGGANNSHTILFTFQNNLVGTIGTDPANASVVTGPGSVVAGTGTVTGIGPAQNQYTVNLTGVTDANYVTVALHSVSDTAGNVGDVATTMGVLLGDVTANGVVTNTDVSAVKGVVDPTTLVTQANCRYDVTVNGFVTNTDVSVVKGQVNPTGGIPMP